MSRRREPPVSLGVPWQDRTFLVLVALLPLHTVFLSAWISWKPYLAVLIVLAASDLLDGVRGRRWPWHRNVSLALVVFGAAAMVGFPVPEHRERFVRLLLAVAVGGLVTLVTERRLRRPGLADRSLRVVFWTGAAIGVTAVGFSLVAVGAFGADAVEALASSDTQFRFYKPAYLKSGFLALTNWHQDPGYGAAWAVLWSVLVSFAVFRGQGSGRWWADGMVIGGLGFSVIMAFSRTGWLALPIALSIASLVLIRRWGAPPAEVGKRLGAGALTAVLLLGVVWSVDVEEVGGDLDLQFAFRFSQGWDLLASITGLFATSDSFADRFDESEERADVWPEYFAMFREHPVTGVGLGVGWETNSARQEPHNLFLQLAAEMGLLGLAAFALLLAAVVAGGTGPVGAVALVTTFLPSLTQTVLFEPTWWFAAGVYLAGRHFRITDERDQARLARG